MCDCVEKIKKDVAEERDVAEVEIDGVYLLFKGIFVPKMSLSYKKKNKNGELFKNKTYKTLMPSYCPFCGKIYDSEK